MNVICETGFEVADLQLLSVYNVWLVFVETVRVVFRGGNGKSV